jgi:hypothetical protein
MGYVEAACGMGVAVLGVVRGMEGVPGARLDGNSTRGRGYPRIPDPTGKGMGINSRPRVWIWVKIITRGHTTGRKLRPRALPVTRI